MEIETVETLAEQLADWFGIYGGCKNINADSNYASDNNCTYDKSNPFCCRQGFVSAISERMREAVENEKKLESVGLS